MTWVALAFILAAVASWAVERAAASRGSGRLSLAALPARLAVLAVLFVFWFGLFRRPLLAAFATSTTVAIITLISIQKRKLVGEPLVFSDFGLLRLVVRHPDLYYTDFLARPPFVGGVLALLTGLVVWLVLEPPVVALSPLGGPALSGGLLAVIAAIWGAAGRRRLAQGAVPRYPRPDLEAHVGRWGLLLTLVAYALGWRLEGASAIPFSDTAPSGPTDGSPAPALVVVVQIESFMDPAALGRPDIVLPGWTGAKAHALLSGRLRVPADGAYTMRSEYAVLTGLTASEQGFAAFDPYLSARAGVPTLASRLRRRGYRTLFMHPFRAAFFDRDVAVPRLGFDRALWEPDFAAAERFGPYVSDMAVVRRILDEAGADGQARSLIYAVTMENHGPWPDGRLAGATGSMAQYLTHLARSDLAVDALVEGLARLGRAALLCIYGDHPPILPGRTPERDPMTDYVILTFGSPPQRAETRDLTAAELGRILMRIAGAPPARPEVSEGAA